MKFFLIPLFLFSLLLSSSVLFGASDTTWLTPQEKRIKKRAENLLRQHKWTEIENWLSECRTNKSRTTDGNLQIEIIYMGLSADSHLKKQQEDEQWLQWFKLLQGWKNVYPQSLGFTVVEMSFWNAYAWKGRGTGYVSTVKEGGFDLFRKRLNLAKEIQVKSLEKTKVFPCGGFYYETLRTSLGLG